MTKGSEEIWKAFSFKLKRFILNRVRDESTAEDILQDVFLKIHNRINTLKDDEKVESWIFRITRNAVTDHYRTRKPSGGLDESRHPATSGRERNAHDEIAADLRDMIEDLPSPYREALLLTEYESVSQKDYALRLGLSHSGAKSRVQRARRMLKDSLLRCCHFQLDQYGRIVDYHEISCCCCNPRD